MHIDKEKTRVVMLVDRFRIIGDMFMYPGARLLDIVNVKEQKFLPLTDAQIFSLKDGKLLHSTSFLAVNRSAVNFFYPTDVEGMEEGQD